MTTNMKNQKVTYIKPTLIELGKMRIITKDNDVGSFTDAASATKRSKT